MKRQPPWPDLIHAAKLKPGRRLHIGRMDAFRLKFDCKLSTAVRRGLCEHAPHISPRRNVQAEIPDAPAPQIEVALAIDPFLDAPGQPQNPQQITCRRAAPAPRPGSPGKAPPAHRAPTPSPSHRRAGAKRPKRSSRARNISASWESFPSSTFRISRPALSPLGRNSASVSASVDPCTSPSHVLLRALARRTTPIPVSAGVPEDSESAWAPPIAMNSSAT